MTIRGRRWSAWPVVAVLGLLAAMPAIQPVKAAFSATASNPGNTLAAASSFPDYPTSVTADSPWAYHRGEDTTSNVATSTAADSSGNARPGTYFGMTNGPSTQWSLAEGSGTVTADVSGAGNRGSIGSGNAWLTNRSDSVLTFSGTTPSTGYVLGSGPGVHTDQSFTVSAWVYATQNSAAATAVSQVGTTSSGFMLLGTSGGKWRFTMTQSDVTNASVDLVDSGSALTTNAWVHLAGVYDNSTTLITLYVNGVSQGTTAHTSLWDATGALQAGRTQWNGAFTDGWAGRIDDVRTYRRALSAGEVAALYGGNPSTAWDLEENTGTSTADWSGNGNTGTLVGGGTTWASPGHSGNGVTFSGSTANAITGANAVTTNSSFSVAAWAYPTNLASTNQAVASQIGNTSSGFNLKITSSKWAVTMARTDTVGPTLDQATAPTTTTVNTWSHLVFVYDSATTPNMTLYVNGANVATKTTSSPFNATNGFVVGRSLYNNSITDAFYGSVDDVRTYRRALTATEVANIYTSTAAMTAGVPGALQGAQQGLQAGTAVAFNGTGNAYNNTLVASPGAATFTLECWFKVASGQAGALIGYNTVATGVGGSYDRLIYIDTNGKLRFGVNPGSTTTIVSPLTYSDGAWHHVAATLSSGNGMRLYVDAGLVASNGAVTTAASSAGYWRWGGLKLTGWTNRPNNPYLVGTLDEVAVYTTELTQQQISRHFHANH